MGWLGKKNLGDDACFEATKKLLKKHLHLHYSLLARYYKELEKPERYNFFICGGGTLLSAWGAPWDKCIEKIIQRKIPFIIFGSGVQPLHFYWPGKTNCSPENRKLLYKIIGKAALVGVRGLDSKRTLLRVGCSEKKINVIGDPAFVCNAGGKNLFKKIRKKLGKRKIIGINIGTCYNNLLGRNENFLRKEMTLFTRYLIKKKFGVVFFPVWPEDLKMQNSVVNKVKSKHIYNIKKVQSVAATIKLIKNLDVLVGEKLHSTVFATCVGTPFISLAYRPKCIELAKSVGCGKYVVRTDEKIFPKLKKLLREVLEKRDEIKNTLIEKRDMYRKRLDLFAEDVAKIIKRFS